MILNSPYISGSLTVTGNIIASGSITLSGSVASASYAASATSASYALNATTASYAVSATTASYADALTVAGTLTAQTLVVQTITSSVDFVTGSTQFGSLLTNTHVFSGSVIMNPNGLFVSSSGVVGIGTITPTGKLGVNGSISLDGTASSTPSVGGVARLSNGYTYFVGNSTGNGAILGNGDGTATVQALATGGSTGYIIFETGAGSEKMRITSAGLVGIGTTNPSTALHVSSSSTQVTLHNNAGGTNARRIGMFMTSGDTFKILSLNDNNTTRTDNILVANVLNGNVGIGTASPSSLLNVSGGLVDINKDGQSLRIFPQTSSGSARIQLQNSGSGGLAGANAIIAVESVAGADQFTGTSPFSFVIGTATQKAFHLGANSAVVMTITGSSVGIGTTNPAQKFEVVGGEIKAGRVDSSQEGGQVSFGRASDNNTTWYIDTYGSSTSPQLRFVNVDNSVVAMTLTGSNIGMGTSNPQDKLDVTGGSIRQLSSDQNSAAKYGTKIIHAGSAFDNPLVSIYTAGTGTNAVAVVKVTVYQTAFGSQVANIQVGYAILMGQNASGTTTSMTVEYNGGIGGVGTLSWSGHTLQYQTSRVSNYDSYTIRVELAGSLGTNSF